MCGEERRRDGGVVRVGRSEGGEVVWRGGVGVSDGVPSFVFFCVLG